MIERYTIKAAPAVKHAEILKRLNEQADFSPEDLKRLQHLKVKIEVVCEAQDYKKITGMLKNLSLR